MHLAISEPLLLLQCAGFVPAPPLAASARAASARAATARRYHRLLRHRGLERFRRGPFAEIRAFVVHGPSTPVVGPRIQERVVLRDCRVGECFVLEEPGDDRRERRVIRHLEDVADRSVTPLRLPALSVNCGTMPLRVMPFDGDTSLGDSI